MNLLPSEAEYWDDRYHKNDIPWDINEISEPLKVYFDQITNKNLKILIPGAGLAHEAHYLLSQEFTDITVCDISEIAIKFLDKKFAGNPYIKLKNQDFFELSGFYDLIIEQTFFCALHPSFREAYCIKMLELLNDNAKLTGLLFDKYFDSAGPPYGGSYNEYQTLFNNYFDIKIMDKCNNSIKPRANQELFFICQKPPL